MQPVPAAETTLRVVVFPDGGLWVAQCLELDLAISARERDELPQLVRNQLRGQAELDRQRGRRPFSSLKPAPPIFQDLYDESRPWRQVALGGADENVVSLATSQHPPLKLRRA